MSFLPNYLHRALCLLLTISVTFSSVPFPTTAYAQGLPQNLINLPAPGTRITPSPAFTPILLKGITIHPDNPMKFEFIVDGGDSELSQDEAKKESEKLIKYFLAALTVPEHQVWVNLSPYEADRMIPKEFGTTAMGIDMLSQDYVLKQLTSSLIYPEDGIGQSFWDKIYERAYKLYGTTDIPINTFNKVWIVPDKAEIYESTDTAYVVKSRLKVMLEEDYEALRRSAQSRAETGDMTVQSNLGNTGFGTAQQPKEQVNEINNFSSKIVREVILPEIEKEVNEGINFANLRQIYNSLILATWYKQNLRQSLLGQLYIDKNKVRGVDVQDKSLNQKVYDQYIEAFKKGTYNYIKEEFDQYQQKTTVRRYFSGGFSMTTPDGASLSTMMKKATRYFADDNVLLRAVARARALGQKAWRAAADFLDVGPGAETLNIFSAGQPAIALAGGGSIDLAKVEESKRKSPLRLALPEVTKPQVETMMLKHFRQGATAEDEDQMAKFLVKHGYSAIEHFVDLLCEDRGITHQEFGNYEIPQYDEELLGELPKEAPPKANDVIHGVSYDVPYTHQEFEMERLRIQAEVVLALARGQKVIVTAGTGYIATAMLFLAADAVITAKDVGEPVVKLGVVKKDRQSLRFNGPLSGESVHLYTAIGWQRIGGSYANVININNGEPPVKITDKSVFRSFIEGRKRRNLHATFFPIFAVGNFILGETEVGVAKYADYSIIDAKIKDYTNDSLFKRIAALMPKDAIFILESTDWAGYFESRVQPIIDDEFRKRGLLPWPLVEATDFEGLASNLEDLWGWLIKNNFVSYSALARGIVQKDQIKKKKIGLDWTEVVKKLNGRSLVDLLSDDHVRLSKKWYDISEEEQEKIIAELFNENAAKVLRILQLSSKGYIVNQRKIANLDYINYYQGIIGEEKNEKILDKLKEIIKEAGHANGAYSPHFVIPGSQYKKSILEIIKYVGGITKGVGLRTKELMKSLGLKVRLTAIRVAEWIKANDNAFQQGQLELPATAMRTAEEIGANFWDEIEALGRTRKDRPAYRKRLIPQTKVGGYCVSKELRLVIESIMQKFGISPLEAIEVFVTRIIAADSSERRPESIIDRFIIKHCRKRGISLKDFRAGLIGLGFKERINDDRWAATTSVFSYLVDLSVKIFLGDPFIFRSKQLQQIHEHNIQDLFFGRKNQSSLKFNGVEYHPEVGGEYNFISPDLDLIMPITPNERFRSERHSLKYRSYMDSDGEIIKEPGLKAVSVIARMLGREGILVMDTYNFFLDEDYQEFLAVDFDVEAVGKGHIKYIKEFLPLQKKIQTAEDVIAEWKLMLENEEMRNGPKEHPRRIPITIEQIKGAIEVYETKIEFFRAQIDERMGKIDELIQEYTLEQEKVLDKRIKREFQIDINRLKNEQKYLNEQRKLRKDLPVDQIEGIYKYKLMEQEDLIKRTAKTNVDVARIDVSGGNQKSTITPDLARLEEDPARAAEKAYWKHMASGERTDPNEFKRIADDLKARWETLRADKLKRVNNEILAVTEAPVISQMKAKLRVLIKKMTAMLESLEDLPDGLLTQVSDTLRESLSKFLGGKFMVREIDDFNRELEALRQMLPNKSKRLYDLKASQSERRPHLKLSPESTDMEHVDLNKLALDVLGVTVKAGEGVAITKRPKEYYTNQTVRQREDERVAAVKQFGVHMIYKDQIPPPTLEKLEAEISITKLTEWEENFQQSIVILDRNCDEFDEEAYAQALKKADELKQLDVFVIYREDVIDPTTGKMLTFIPAQVYKTNSKGKLVKEEDQKKMTRMNAAKWFLDMMKHMKATLGLEKHNPLYSKFFARVRLNEVRVNFDLHRILWDLSKAKIAVFDKQKKDDYTFEIDDLHVGYVQVGKLVEIRDSEFNNVIKEFVVSEDGDRFYIEEPSIRNIKLPENWENSKFRVGLGFELTFENGKPKMIDDRGEDVTHKFNIRRKGRTVYIEENEIGRVEFKDKEVFTFSIGKKGRGIDVYLEAGTGNVQEFRDTHDNLLSKDSIRIEKEGMVTKFYDRNDGDAYLGAVTVDEKNHVVRIDFDEKHHGLIEGEKVVSINEIETDKDNEIFDHVFVPSSIPELTYNALELPSDARNYLLSLLKKGRYLMTWKGDKQDNFWGLMDVNLASETYAKGRGVVLLKKYEDNTYEPVVATTEDGKEFAINLKACGSHQEVDAQDIILDTRRIIDGGLTIHEVFDLTYNDTTLGRFEMEKDKLMLFEVEKGIFAYIRDNRIEAIVDAKKRNVRANYNIVKNGWTSEIYKKSGELVGSFELAGEKKYNLILESGRYKITVNKSRVTSCIILNGNEDIFSLLNGLKPRNEVRTAKSRVGQLKGGARDSPIRQILRAAGTEEYIKGLLARAPFRLTFSLFLNLAHRLMTIIREVPSTQRVGWQFYHPPEGPYVLDKMAEQIAGLNAMNHARLLLNLIVNQAPNVDNMYALFLYWATGATDEDGNIYLPETRWALDAFLKYGGYNLILQYQDYVGVKTNDHTRINLQWFHLYMNPLIDELQRGYFNQKKFFANPETLEEFRINPGQVTLNGGNNTWKLEEYVQKFLMTLWENGMALHVLRQRLATGIDFTKEDVFSNTNREYLFNPSSAKDTLRFLDEEEKFLKTAQKIYLTGDYSLLYTSTGGRFDFEAAFNEIAAKRNMVHKIVLSNPVSYDQIFWDIYTMGYYPKPELEIYSMFDFKKIASEKDEMVNTAVQPTIALDKKNPNSYQLDTIRRNRVESLQQNGKSLPVEELAKWGAFGIVPAYFEAWNNNSKFSAIRAIAENQPEKLYFLLRQDINETLLESTNLQQALGQMNFNDPVRVNGDLYFSFGFRQLRIGEENNGFNGQNGIVEDGKVFCKYDGATRKLEHITQEQYEKDIQAHDAKVLKADADIQNFEIDGKQGKIDVTLEIDQNSNETIIFHHGSGSEKQHKTFSSLASNHLSIIGSKLTFTSSRKFREKDLILKFGRDTITADEFNEKVTPDAYLQALKEIFNNDPDIDLSGDGPAIEIIQRVFAIKDLVNKVENKPSEAKGLIGRLEGKEREPLNDEELRKLNRFLMEVNVQAKAKLKIPKSKGYDSSRKFDFMYGEGFEAKTFDDEVWELKEVIKREINRREQAGEPKDKQKFTLIGTSLGAKAIIALAPKIAEIYPQVHKIVLVSPELDPKSRSGLALDKMHPLVRSPREEEMLSGLSKLPQNIQVLIFQGAHDLPGRLEDARAIKTQLEANGNTVFYRDVDDNHNLSKPRSQMILQTEASRFLLLPDQAQLTRTDNAALQATPDNKIIPTDTDEIDPDAAQFQGIDNAQTQVTAPPRKSHLDRTFFDGRKFFVLALGTLGWERPWPSPDHNPNWKRAEQKEVDQLLLTALKYMAGPHGVIVVDTARAYGSEEYGHSEEMLANFLKRYPQYRDKIIFFGKVGEMPLKKDELKGASAFTIEKTDESVKTTLSFLDKLGVLFLHNPTIEVLQDSEYRAAFMAKKDDDKIQHMGVSISNPTILKEAVDKNLLTGFEVLQMPVNVYLDPAHQGMINTIAAQGIKFVLNHPGGLDVLDKSPEQFHQVYQDLLNHPKINLVFAILTGSRTTLAQSVLSVKHPEIAKTALEILKSKSPKGKTLQAAYELLLTEAHKIEQTIEDLRNLDAQGKKHKSLAPRFNNRAEALNYLVHYVLIEGKDLGWERETIAIPKKNGTYQIVGYLYYWMVMEHKYPMLAAGGPAFTPHGEAIVIHRSPAVDGAAGHRLFQKDKISIVGGGVAAGMSVEDAALDEFHAELGFPDDYKLKKENLVYMGQFVRRGKKPEIQQLFGYHMSPEDYQVWLAHKNNPPKLNGDGQIVEVAGTYAIPASRILYGKSSVQIASTETQIEFSRDQLSRIRQNPRFREKLKGMIQTRFGFEEYMVQGTQGKMPVRIKRKTGSNRVIVAAHGLGWGLTDIQSRWLSQMVDNGANFSLVYGQSSRRDVLIPETITGNPRVKLTYGDKSFDDEVEDYRILIREAIKRFGDDVRIALAGRSAGGQIAPILAHEFPQVEWVIPLMGSMETVAGNGVIPPHENLDPISRLWEKARMGEAWGKAKGVKMLAFWGTRDIGQGNNRDNRNNSIKAWASSEWGKTADVKFVELDDTHSLTNPVSFTIYEKEVNAFLSDTGSLQTTDTADLRFTQPRSAADMTVPDSISSRQNNNPGGINFDAALLDMQIKRDGNGVPLPIIQQPMNTIRIEGIVPVITNFTPISIPLLLGLNCFQEDVQDEICKENGENGVMELSSTNLN